jgi:hypothetical protein
MIEILQFEKILKLCNILDLKIRIEKKYMKGIYVLRNDIEKIV